MTCELIRPAEILYRWLVNTRSLGINIRFHFAGKPGLGHEMTALFSATVDFILAFESLSVFKHTTSVIISACYFVILLFSFLCFFFVFSKGSVNVDFRVIIVINATDPKNASAIPDAKAQTTHQVVREAKTGFVKQLQVSPVVEVFSKYQLVTSTRNS